MLLSSPGEFRRVSYYTENFGPFVLRWERHTEFTTFTFIREVYEAFLFDDIFDHVLFPLQLCRENMTWRSLSMILLSLGYRLHGGNKFLASY